MSYCYTVISVLANHPRFTASSNIFRIFSFQTSTNARKLELLQSFGCYPVLLTRAHTQKNGRNRKKMRPETLECLFVEIFFLWRKAIAVLIVLKCFSARTLNNHLRLNILNSIEWKPDNYIFFASFSFLLLRNNSSQQQ